MQWACFVEVNRLWTGELSTTIAARKFVVAGDPTSLEDKDCGHEPSLRKLGPSRLISLEQLAFMSCPLSGRVLSDQLYTCLPRFAQPGLVPLLFVIFSPARPSTVPCLLLAVNI